MILSVLVKKGGLASIMTATPATSATQKVDTRKTVASVAGVAVADTLTPLFDLSLEEESRIRTWLLHIEESDPAIIADVLNKCRRDLEVRRYILRSTDILKRSTPEKTVSIVPFCGS